MLKKLMSIAVFLLLLVLAPLAVQAQVFLMDSPTTYDSLATIPRNSVLELHAEGDTLWAASPLTYTVDGGETWYVPRLEDLAGEDVSIFSMDVETPAGEAKSTVWVGLGSTDDHNNDGTASPFAEGFLVSPDGGEHFLFRAPPLGEEIFAGGRPVQFDSVQYGDNVLLAERITDPLNSPPFDIDFAPALGDSGVVWTAGWAGGLRRSFDGGRTWRRVVLPPDNLFYIHPDSTYNFALAPFRGRVNDPGSYNHTAFSVLVDETQTVWVGTPLGINFSYPDEVFENRDRAWHRVKYNGTPNGLTGSWVTSIEEQPLPGRNPIWMATWAAGGIQEQSRTGVSVTFDGGETFQQVLYTGNGAPDRPTDFGFRGDTVYVAGQANGLFVTTDKGRSWRSIEHFDLVDEQQPFVQPSDVRVYTVETTPGALWIGTSIGILKSTDGGETWRLFRTDVPLHPSEPSEAVPDVETYAYPNPFSPAIDELIRIRFGAQGNGEVEIRIFDFRMQLVRRLAPECAGGRTCEAIWNGRDDGGYRVANGPYFYRVDVGGETVWGKILVLE